MRSSVVLSLALLLGACGGEEAETEESTAAAESAATEEGEAHGGHDHGDEAAMAPLPAVPEGASVSFLSPADGATVSGPLEDGAVTVHVEMGAEGIEVRPAGEVVAGTGHHHIIIDGEGVPEGTAVPADETHIHYGGGQTEADLSLAPGQHTLRLQFADGMHRSYGASMSSAITVSVAEEPGADAPEGDEAAAEDATEG